nr:uncharacterized protein CXorf38 homolog [Nerophis lumbriciformis]
MSKELVLRLNNRNYANWLKAGQCLYILTEALCPFTDEKMQNFHQYLLRDMLHLREPCQGRCHHEDIKHSRACNWCLHWKSVILSHHRQPNSMLNWENCTPAAWRTNHWELAKAYMPRGQAHVRTADQCDPSALLNLINFCDCFAIVNVHSSLVRELIRCRNALMHSADMHVTDEWMKKFKVTLTRFVQLFDHVPSMAGTEQKLTQMLAVDLSICAIDVVDDPEMELATDSVTYNVMPEKIFQWEADLLQERLQELKHMAEDETMDTNQLKMLECFLQQNKDLSEKFSGQLQAISMLVAEQRKT